MSLIFMCLLTFPTFHYFTVSAVLAKDKMPSLCGSRSKVLSNLQGQGDPAVVKLIQNLINDLSSLDPSKPLDVKGFCKNISKLEEDILWVQGCIVTPPPFFRWQTTKPVPDSGNTSDAVNITKPMRTRRSLCATADLFSSLETSVLSKVINSRRSNCSQIGQAFNESGNACYTMSSVTLSKKRLDAYTESVISYVGNSISTLCLLALLIIYGKVGELRTVAGKNLMLLSSLLGTIHLLQAVGAPFKTHQAFCTGVGILLHWLYLSAFTAMAVTGYDLFKIFASSLAVTLSASKDRFKTYAMITIVFPTTAVLCCIVMEFTTERVIGYGAEGRCFVGKFWPNLVTFSLPVVLVMFANSLFMSLIIYKIYTGERESNVMLSRHKGKGKMLLHSAALCFKVSTVIGLTWITAVLGSALGNTNLLYVSTCLTSLQGAFVFLAFCCNKRTYNLITKARRTRSFIIETKLSVLKGSSTKEGM